MYKYIYTFVMIVKVPKTTIMVKYFTKQIIEVISLKSIQL